MRSIEICAGAGGQALGIEQAGFEHIALVEIDKYSCQTLRINRPEWNIFEGDVKLFSAKKYVDVDLLSGGVPCPPFSVAGKQLGHEDDRDLFPEALRLVRECNPKAVMLENVRGLFDPKFKLYREKILEELTDLGYVCEWKLIHAHHYGVSQLRPRTVLVALKKEFAYYFNWPLISVTPPPSVGQLLLGEMSSNGWEGAEAWANQAVGIAPTIVGGSKKHGGPDLGPTRAREAWRKLGVDGGGIADEPPPRRFIGLPRLTLKMVAKIQGFPEDWVFYGKKTPAYRQIGNAFPPPVARAVASSIYKALTAGDRKLSELEAKSS